MRASWNCTPWNSPIGLAELLALLHVRDRVIERALREAEHLRADADAAFVERFDRDLVALADLAEDLRLRHHAVFEHQLAGAAGADAELVFLLADRESRRAAIDDERGDAAVARIGIDVGEHDEHVRFVAVGDPQLAAVDREAVALFGGARRHREGVAARAGFGQAIGADRARWRAWAGTCA